MLLARQRQELLGHCLQRLVRLQGVQRFDTFGASHDAIRPVTDHRFEQRGLLHAQVLVEGTEVHVVVVHLGLIHASRERQVQRLGQFIQREIPANAPLVVAGDFNDWSAKLLAPMANLDLRTFDGIRLPTFPSRLPLLHLDRIYVRGLRPVSAHVPHGRAWARMSDHLPLVAELSF